MDRANALFLSGVMKMPPDERIRAAKALFRKMEDIRDGLLAENEPVSKMEEAMLKLDERAANFAAIHQLSWGSS